MKTMVVSETTTVEEVIAAVDQDDVLLYREGKPVALLSAFDEDDLEWYVREREPAFVESIARARQQVEAGQTLSQEALKQQLGLD
ncbi:MAG: hypothetical protein KY476_01400 [Planctomycetes bacterium]|nr:hypothetical protein [Planctomycetota bacterium]